MQGQFDRTLNVARVFPWFQTRLKYAEHYVAGHLAEQNVRTTFLTTDHVLSSLHAIVPYERPGPYWDSDYAWFRYRSISLCDKPLVFPSRLGKIIASDRFDVFHLTGVGVPLTIQFLLEHRVVGSTTPIVVSDHSTTDTGIRNGVSQKLYFAWLRMMLLPLRSRINVLLSFSDESADLIRGRFGLGGTRTEIVKLGYDPSVFRPLSFREKCEFYRIGFAGKIVEAKRLDVLIKAIGNCGSRDTIELVVAGLADAASELKERLFNQAKQLNVRLVAQPLLDPEHLCSFYNSLDLAVFPGSISITTLEASGCGIPILLYESIAGLECRVQNGRGLLFSDRGELTKLISQTMRSPETDEVRLQRAERTAEEFGWKNLSRHYANIYKDIASRGTHGYCS